MDNIIILNFYNYCNYINYNNLLKTCIAPVIAPTAPAFLHVGLSKDLSNILSENLCAFVLPLPEPLAKLSSTLVFLPVESKVSSVVVFPKAE